MGRFEILRIHTEKNVVEVGVYLDTIPETSSHLSWKAKCKKSFEELVPDQTGP